jgi:hypothetical protein
MRSKAATVTEYLASLPADRRAALAEVRRIIRENLDPLVEEGMQYGMIGYYIPHRVYPAGYHCDPAQPLPFAGLASQSGHMSLYLCWMYYNAPALQALKKAWTTTGKKLDMGASCIRFKRLDDLSLDVLGKVVKAMPATKFIEMYDAVRPAPRKKAPAKSASKLPSPKKPPPKTTKKASPKARAARPKPRR